MTSGNADTLTVERKLSQLDLRPYEATTGAAAFGFARRGKSNEQVSTVRGRGARRGKSNEQVSTVRGRGARRGKSDEEVGNVRGRGARSDRRNGHKQNEIYRKKQLTFEIKFSNNDNSYKEFFVITPDDGENLSTADNIKENQDLEMKLGGEPKRITELRNGALLVEVQNEQQSKKIKIIKNLHTMNIISTEYNTLNKSKGTI